MLNIDSQAEIMALLWELRAFIEDIHFLTDDDRLLLEKVVAVTNASVQLDRALKLKPTGDAYRDNLVAARLDVRS
jgi:hypothetical protein